MERRIVNPWTWQDQLGYVQANEISGMERVLVCAGQTSVDADGQPFADIVRLNFFVTDVDGFLQAGEIYGARLAKAGCRPATTLLGVSRLALPPLLVAVEATAAK